MSGGGKATGIAAIRAALAGVSVPYMKLAPRVRDAQAAALPFIEAGVVEAYNVPISLDGSTDWSGAGLHRGGKYSLHALGPLEILFLAHDAARDATRGAEVLASLCAAVDSWVRWSEGGGECRDTDGSDLVWYDMAAGMRVYRLAYMLTAAAESPLVGDDAYRLWLSSLERHRAWLAEDANFAAHNNHGLFQAAGQIAAGRRLAALPGMAEMAAQGEARLRGLLAQHFSSEGVHLEHSPAYHDMIAHVLQGLLDCGAIGDAATLELAKRCVEATEWMRIPDGTLVNFGDSDTGRGDSDRPVSAGPFGHRFYSESGYWFVRPEAGGGASYLAQTCAFHSRTHKHCDDAGFVWHEDGLPILIDGGRYGYIGRQQPGSPLFQAGYWYADPKRVHVERSRAHNTVEVDGRNWNRRERPPSRSGLRRAEAGEGVFASLAVTTPVLWPVQHHRVLVYRPGEWVLCFDRLQGEPGESHDFRQWFNFAEGIAVEERGDRHLRLRDPRRERAIELHGLCPQAAFETVAAGVSEPGEDEHGYPRLVGWHSREAESFYPNLSVSLVRRGENAAWFATLLALEPTTIDGDATQVAQDGGRARFGWTQGGRVYRLATQTEDDDAPLASLETEEAGGSAQLVPPRTGR